MTLVLRRGHVVEAGAADGPEQRLSVDVPGRGPRAAIADVALVGAAQRGDDVVVNTQAADLALGSGGFDVVHVNLTRGLDGEGVRGAHVMKLNYSSLQHAVLPVEGPGLHAPLGRPVGVASLHGQLAPLAWAAGRARPGLRLGYVQTPGGALPGGHSRVVRTLRERGLLAGFLTAGAAYGGEGEAISTAGALQHGLHDLGWDAAVCAPGPGILGSASALGHGGMTALDSAHAALAMGCPVVLCARMSSGDERERHRGLSHHTRTVLELLLADVVVAAPPGAADLVPAGPHHRVREGAADLGGYRTAALPDRTMGRTIDEDELFFTAALAAGSVLAAARAEVAR
ncbi:MAG TPA: DUF3866 family protein [Solirubrobacteraceae bacterium]